MKRLILFAFLTGTAFAQTNRFPPINTYVGDPTGGACSIANSIVQSTTTGGMYSCVSGVWTSSTIPFNGGTIANPLNGTSATFSGLNQGQLRDNGGEKFNLLAFGAVSDAKVSKVCSMTAGSAVLTCDDAPFVAGDVGKPISVQYAGPTFSGVVNGQLITTISGFTDASHVTLAATATNTTPVGLVDPDGLRVQGGAGNYDLGPGSVTSISGSIVGTLGQTCTLTNFNHGLTTATATITLDNINSVSNGSAYLVTGGGDGGSDLTPPTTATLGNGTATCSGTVTVSSNLDVGFGYYSGQWATTTTGSGTGLGVSIVGGMTGGGIANLTYPHGVVYSGTNYAVNDVVCPTIIGADGHGCLLVTAVNKTSAIWGTDNWTAISAWSAACNGSAVTKGKATCYIPNGQFLVTSAGNTHQVKFASNTKLAMDRQGSMWVTGFQPGFCTNAGWYVFGTANNATNVLVDGFHHEGELQVGPTTRASNLNCGAIAFAIGSNNRNIRITNSIFNHLQKAGVVTSANDGSDIQVDHISCDTTMDSCVNTNSANTTIAYNTFVGSATETGGGPNLHMTNNTYINDVGQWAMAIGGATGGRPYYGGDISHNLIINPITGAMSISSGFSRGQICDNTITGMQGWSSVNYGLNQASGLVNVASFGNNICNNKFESAGGGNGAAYGLSVSTTLLATNQLGNTVSNNVATGFGTPLLLNGSSTTYGHGNIWAAANTNYDMGIGTGNPTYISAGDILAHGTYTFNNPTATNRVNGNIQGYFYNGVSGGGMQLFNGARFSQGNLNNSWNWMLNSGLLQSYGLGTLQVAPPAVSVTVVGTVGSTTYTYFCTGVDGNGKETNSGTPASITGPDTLSTSAYLVVNCPAAFGADHMNVYRSAGGALSTGKIGQSVSAYTVLLDTGQTASGSAPATNNTGYIYSGALNRYLYFTGSQSYIPTGPNVSTANNVMTANDTTGGIKDSGVAITSLCQTSGTNCPTRVTLVASGSLALATNSIAAAPGCQAITAGSVNSATATGATVATDTLTYSTNGSLSAVTGYTASTSGGLTINGYITAGFVNFDVCNWSSSAITPGAVTLIWKVTR